MLLLCDVGNFTKFLEYRKKIKFPKIFQIKLGGRKSSLTPNVINMVLGYLFGATASISLVTMAKFTVGRLRPHFFDVCNLNYSMVDCGTDYHPNYVTNYDCQGNVNVSTYT